ncbi:hypothetical protein QAD02_001754 [Eretmocerus hayati]|uniref:Uncharacterized protein n=1 Tax=Eretmocerus hayati TaxID=131215 RepID=A0ACC2NH07_9HYME|nr:hypothetical protein QAD02_001754 [Eretmocerus hayati]
MHQILTLILAGLVCCNFFVAAISDEKNESNIFVPTNEWQPIGDKILPHGIHARINLQTGVKEAKLIDENETRHEKEKKENSLSVVAGQDRDTGENDATDQVESKISLDELKVKLKKIKSDVGKSPQQSKDPSQDHLRGTGGFKSLSELKKEFAALNLTISTDSEVLSNLFERFESYKDTITLNDLDPSQLEDVLEILSEMEDLVHQVDNGRLFADLQGMTRVISPCLNSTQDEVKSEALKLLGAAVQLNPSVQLKALESDLVKKLLHMLSINNAVGVKSKCMFALGALTRNFPPAQVTLVKNGGLELFGNILSNGDFQIQTRIILLVTHLMTERQDLERISDNKKKLERIELYHSTNFERELVTQKYCQNMVHLAIKSMQINHEIDDFHEILYESMISLAPACKKEFAIKREDLLSEFKKMAVKYRDFPKVNDDGENLNARHIDLIEQLQTLFGALQQHDEL